MDLGIKGRRALVCASSKGLGRGCAQSLAAEGVDLVLNARGAEALKATSDAIRAAHGVNVIAVAADITTEAGQAEVLAAAGSIDILVTNAGGPPPGNWRDWSRDDFIAALDANMLAPIAIGPAAARSPDRHKATDPAEARCSRCLRGRLSSGARSGLSGS